MRLSGLVTPRPAFRLRRRTCSQLALTSCCLQAGLGNDNRGRQRGQGVSWCRQCLCGCWLGVYLVQLSPRDFIFPSISDLAFLCIARPDIYIYIFLSIMGDYGLDLSQTQAVEESIFPCAEANEVSVLVTGFGVCEIPL